MVGGKAVKKVVNNVGAENLNAHFCGSFFCVLVDFDVEAKEHGEFRGSIDHDCATHDILLVHRTNINPSNLNRK